jgi:hypothetical protein
LQSSEEKFLGIPIQSKKLQYSEGHFLAIPIQPKKLLKTTSAHNLVADRIPCLYESPKSKCESCVRTFNFRAHGRIKTPMSSYNKNNWDFLRSQLVQAKVRDAFSTRKIDVNGHCYRVLRVLGKGGSAQVNLKINLNCLKKYLYWQHITIATYTNFNLIFFSRKLIFDIW